MTPPPSELTTGEVIARRTFPSFPDLQRGLAREIDAALDEEVRLSRWRYAQMQNLSTHLRAAEQREREAGESGKLLRDLALKLAIAVRHAFERSDATAMRCFGTNAPAFFAADIERALAAIRSGPAQPSTSQSDLAKLLASGRRVDAVDKYLDLDKRVGCDRPDGTMNIHAESETCEVCAPAPVSDPPTAKGETGELIWVSAKRFVELEAEERQLAAIAERCRKSFGGPPAKGCFCGMHISHVMAVADPTETER